MWVNPKYADLYAGRQDAPPAAEAPPLSGQILGTFPRTQQGIQQELRVSIDEYQGHAYLSVRLWTQDRQSKAWFPTKKGVSIRLREAQGVADAIAEGLRIADQEQPMRPAERDIHPAASRTPMDRQQPRREFSEFE